MNGRVSKLINALARESNIPKKIIKQDYYNTPWNKRNKLFMRWMGLVIAKRANTV